jgi:hypothetical protein
MMQVSDRLLFRIESDRARTTGLKGQIGGSIKEAVHLLREANRAMGQRAAISGDAHYWEDRARKLGEELAKVRAEQELLRKKNLRLLKEIGNLKERMGGFEEDLAASVIPRRRCASPFPSGGAEDMKVDVVESGERRVSHHQRHEHCPSDSEDVQLAGNNMLIASNLMGINEAVRGILGKLEVLESRSRRDPSLAPRSMAPPPERPVGEKERKKRVRKGGISIPVDSEKKKKKRSRKKKKSELSSMAVETPASSMAEPVHTGGETQGTEPASLQVGVPESVPWTKVVGKKNRGKGSRVGELVTPQTPKGPSLPPPSGKGLEKRTDPLKATKRRMKRTAAVVISGPDSYGKAMALARQRINLEEFGIEGLRVRRAFSGGA